MAATPHPAVTTIADRAGRRVADDLQRLHRARPPDAATPLSELVDSIRANCRLTLNFHPDRLDADRRTVGEGLLATGRYRSQFETGLSNGGRFAVPGGQRLAWETELFGPVYANVDATHPVYGALDITRDPHGGAPRFGSSFVVLADHCFDRATFCVGDSHVGPTDVGTIAHFTSIAAGLFEHASFGVALGRELTGPQLERLIAGAVEASEPARELDAYIEAQVHGAIELARDVAAMVLDPSFRGTETETHLTEAASAFDFELRWHGGSELEASAVPDDFRGPTMPPLAYEVARPDGVLDAAAIGRATHTITFTPPSIDGDADDSELQQLKRLWHCLLAFGRDAAGPPASA